MMEDQNNAAITYYDAATVTAPTVIDLDVLIFNQITQGTGETQRIGDKIYPSKILYEGFVVMDSASVSGKTAPNYLRMIILKDKLNQSVNSFNDLFETSSSGPNTQPTNSLLDITRRVNSDRYIVYTQRVFKLGAADVSATGGTQAGNNDFKISKFFKVDLTKHMKKLDFDVSGLTSPANLQVVFVGSYADNSTIAFTPSYDGPANRITSTLRISYRDA